MNGKRLTITLMVTLSIVYFATFIPPNITGSKDENMLTCFQIDEYAQYRILQRMVSSSSSPFLMIKNFFAYRHYYYGFPFYLTSSIAIIPSSLCSHIVKCDHPVKWDILMLRQVSPLFMILSMLLLVYLWTDFRSPLASSLLFLFLAAVPAVFCNNMWWHPDSLAIFFAILTLVCLYKDNLRCSTWYSLAAISCGLATGTKLLGLFMFLTVGSYLVLAWYTSGKGWQPFMKQGVFFIIIVIITVIVSNPMLLVPAESKLIFRTLAEQSRHMSAGWEVYQPKGVLAWYNTVIETYFGHWCFLALALSLNILGLVRRSEKRMVNLLIISWFLPLSAYVIFCIGKKSPEYLLPAFLPLLSCVANIGMLQDNHSRSWHHMVIVGIAMTVSVSTAVQLVSYLNKDRQSYRHTMAREIESPQLAFYRGLAASYLSKAACMKKITMLRDAYVYIPPSKSFEVRMEWGNLNYSAVGRHEPDLIVLEKRNIRHYDSPQVIDLSIDKVRARENQRFYIDAQNEAIPGFVKVFEDSYGVAFARKGR